MEKKIRSWWIADWLMRLMVDGEEGRKGKEKEKRKEKKMRRRREGDCAWLQWLT